MKRVVFLLLVGLVAFVFTTSDVLAEPKKKCSADGKKHERSYKDGSHSVSFFDKMIKKLDLSDDQLVEANKLKNTYKKEAITQKAEIKVAGIELQELLTADKVDLKKVERKIKAIYDMKADLKVYRITEMESFKKLLTPKQKKKLKSCILKGGPHYDKGDKGASHH